MLVIHRYFAFSVHLFEEQALRHVLFELFMDGLEASDRFVMFLHHEER